MRVGYLGPEGTFTHEALIVALERDAGPAAAFASSGSAPTLIDYPTIYDTVLAVHDREVDVALVPIENSLEGSVNATLDALAIDTENVTILGELVHPIHQCLIARTELELGEIEVVVSHPQANAQCGRFIRTRLAGVKVLAGDSTADAVRIVSEHDGRWAALGTSLAAERFGCRVLRSGVEDVPGNETRFVWLGSEGLPPADKPLPASDDPPHTPWKTAIVFWGVGSEAPGWLVRCLLELSERAVNLTRIESRPLKQGLGSYMFFVDLEGRDATPHVAEALAALRSHVEVLRVLGSYPVA